MKVFDNIIPKEPNKLYWFAVLLTTLITFLVGGISIYALGDYGWVVFIGLPFIIGLLPPLLYGYHEPIPKRANSLLIGLTTLLICCACLLLFALEGAICILMASPLLIAFTIIGSLIAHELQLRQKRPTLPNTLLAIGLLAPALMAFEHTVEPFQALPLTPVNTSVLVDAPIENVWQHVVTFSELPKPNEWIFRTGIAYPIQARITGQGVGAIRYCDFSTGSFVEPITTWDEPRLLAFDVEDQPEAMREWSFYDIHPPHLDGYFASKKGQFKLQPLPNGQTNLIGTTWYTLDMAPAAYWGIWSEHIIHAIHQRVLSHIKIQAETEHTCQ